MTINGKKINAKLEKYILGNNVYIVHLTEGQYKSIKEQNPAKLEHDGIEYKIVSIIPFLLMVTK
jgi:hypothetical protein